MKLGNGNLGQRVAADMHGFSVYNQIVPFFLFQKIQNICSLPFKKKKRKNHEKIYGLPMHQIQ
jgi:hypothetical protein